MHTDKVHMKRQITPTREAKRVKSKEEYVPLELVDEELPCVLLEQLHPGLSDGKVQFKKIGHKYYFPWECEEDTKRLAPILSTTTFIGQFGDHFPKEEAAEEKAAKGGYDASEGKGKTKEEILALWEYWADKGTSTHYLFHAYFNRMPYQKGTWEKHLLKRFLADHPNLKIYWSERLLADIELRIGGSADAVFQCLDRPGWFYLVDWKTCRQILRHAIDKCYKVNGKCQPKPGEVCKRYMPHPAVSHLEQCNFNKYSLQLSIYRYMLETTENMRFVGQALVVINGRLLDYDKHETPYLRQEIDDMFTERALAIMP